MKCDGFVFLIVIFFQEILQSITITFHEEHDKKYCEKIIAICNYTFVILKHEIYLQTNRQINKQMLVTELHEVNAI